MNKAKVITRNLRCCGEKHLCCTDCSYRTQQKTKCFDLLKIAAAEELERLDAEAAELRKMVVGLTTEKEKLKEALKGYEKPN
jgi:hypothetical protein